MTRYLTPRELAARWRTSPQGLRLQRHRRRGPPYVKLGRLVRYRLADIVAWEKANQISAEPRS